MLLLMVPSFVVDAVLLHRIITRHPTVLTNEEALDIFGVTIMFFMNFAILKVYALLFYYLLKYIRKRSCVMIHHNKVVYHKRRLVMSAEAYNEAYYIDYEINNIENVIVRKSGTIIVMGAFVSVYICEDEKTEHHKSTRKKVVIPPYYSDMQKLRDKLYLLYKYK